LRLPVSTARPRQGRRRSYEYAEHNQHRKRGTLETRSD
jgi:hypothetical protein